MLDSLPSSADELWDEEEEREAFAKTYWPFLVAGFYRGVGLALNQTGGKKNPQDIFSQFQNAWQLRTLDHAAKAVGTTKGKLQKVIDTAQAEGWSIEKLGTELSKQFNVEKGYRPLRIARTEMTGAVNDGTLKTLIGEGVPGKEWSTVRDGRQRETHDAADGQVVPINGMFTVGGHACLGPGDDRLPVEETANCRCTLVAAGLDEGRKRAHNRAFLRAHGALEVRLVVSLRREFDRQKRRVLDHFPS